MSLTVIAPPHPVLGCVGQVHAALDAVTDVQATYLRTEDKRTALIELARIEARITELRLRVLASADEIGEDTGARDAAAWVSHATRTEPATARADAVLARRLEQRPLAAAAMRRGDVCPAQARIIAAVLDDLPAHLGPQVATDAETTLVAFCDTFRPSDLRRLARRLLEVIAPEIAEAEEARRLRDEEHRALVKAFLKFHDQGNGLTRFWGALPTPIAERLKRYLHAYTSPRQHARTNARNADETADRSDEATSDGTGRESGGESGGTGERMPQNHAHAFSALLEHLDPDRLPNHGGDATTVVITMTLEQLLTDLATAGMITDSPEGETTITAEQARRLACNAGLIPMVLNSQGQPLDIGRESRLHRPHQRKAIRLRDRHCRAEGCTIPAAWCEIHHRQPWSHGGHTTVDDGACFCSHHHHLIHDPRYDHEWTPGGDVRFQRRR